MGCFDSLIVKCPQCKHDIEFQSKAGKCFLNDFSLEDCPTEILGDLHNQTETCQNCGYGATIKVQTMARVE